MNMYSLDNPSFRQHVSVHLQAELSCCMVLVTQARKPLSLVSL